jgi:hypothetical protein
MIFYAGAEGNLEQNYMNFANENLYLSPTLNINHRQRNMMFLLV